MTAKSPLPVLVLRPLRQRDAFLQCLDKAGIAYSYCPIMRIEAIAEPAAVVEQIRDNILKFAEFDQAIFISANAAEIGIDWLDQYWPMLPAQMQIFAVGQQTAEILQDFGCQVLCPQQPNTEGLLNEMRELQEMANKSVIIFRGGGGRMTLGDTLVSRGADVTYCELYHRLIDTAKLEEARSLVTRCGGLVAHSGELLKAMGSAIDDQLPLIVPSERMAAMGRELGYINVQVAENALPESMARAVTLALS